MSSGSMTDDLKIVSKHVVTELVTQATSLDIVTRGYDSFVHTSVNKQVRLIPPTTV